MSRQRSDQMEQYSCSALSQSFKRSQMRKRDRLRGGGRRGSRSLLYHSQSVYYASQIMYRCGATSHLEEGTGSKVHSSYLPSRPTSESKFRLVAWLGRQLTIQSSILQLRTPSPSLSAHELRHRNFDNSHRRNRVDRRTKSYIEAATLHTFKLKYLKRERFTSICGCFWNL